MAKSYTERIELLKEGIDSVVNGAEERERSLLDDMVDEEEVQGRTEDSEEIARRRKRSEIKSRIRNGEAGHDEYLVRGLDLLKDSSRDVELIREHLERMDKRIEVLEDIESDMADVDRVLTPEWLYYDFTSPARKMLNDAVENFRTAGEKEIEQREPSMEGALPVDYVREKRILTFDRELEPGDPDRKDVDWEIEVPEGELKPGKFGKLEREHFEGLKSIAVEIRELRHEMSSAGLVAAFRLGELSRKLDKAGKDLKRSGNKEFADRCGSMEREARELRTALERETLEPLEDALKRAEAFIDDFLEGNKEEIELAVEEGTWQSRWDLPDRYEKD
ncbi:MAG: hypothetical protein ABEJ87_05545 [Candidatus Nanohalobium sp.]